MTIHTTPANRKEMAHAISELLGEPAVYMRTPTYAFQIGSVTVNRDGSTSCDDTDIMERIMPMLIENGYLSTDSIEENNAAPETAAVEAEPIQELTNEPASDLEAVEVEPVQEPTSEPAFDLEVVEAEPIQEPTTEPVSDLETVRAEPVQEPSGEINQVNITLPMEGITVPQLKNLMFMLYSKQNLLNKALGSEFLHVDRSVVTRLQEYTPETVEDFESLLGDFKALDSLTGVTIQDAQLTLNFPFDVHDPTRCEQYGVLLKKIIDAAMKATRMKPQLLSLGDNEKYLMHSWLIRIGCGGPDFKALRKLLLTNLTGYCAFPDQARADKHKAKYAEIRRILRGQ